jgi:hypothetical protein
LEDAVAMERFKTANPRPAKDPRGNPYFDTSNAKPELVNDVRMGNLTGMKPAQMQAQSEAFSEFSAKSFRNHLYRQLRRKKEDHAWQFRRNQQGYQLHQQAQQEAMGAPPY